MVVAGIQRLDRRVLLGLRVVAAVLATLCVLVLAIAGTARATVLNNRYYQRVLDDQRTYDRLYDEVLVDPAAAGLTRDLLARLPIPESALLANLKIVLPPTTLRTLVDDQIGHAVNYLRGDQRTLTLRIDLRPVRENISVLAETYLGDLVASLQHRGAPDFPAFRRALDAALADLAAGRPPTGLPTIQLDAAGRTTAQRLLLAAVPAGSRAEVTPAIAAALDTGDIASALAAVGPFVVGQRAGTAAHDLTSRIGSTWDVVADLDSANVDLGAVRTARTYTALAVGPVQIATVLIALIALAFLWVTGHPQAHRRMIAVGAVLGAGGVLSLVLVLLVCWKVDDLLAGPPGSWPPSLTSLLTNLERTGSDVLLRAGLLGALIPVVIGALLVGGGWLWRRFEAAMRFARQHDKVLLGGMGAVVAGTLVLGTLVPAFAGRAPLRCLGSTRMCSLRYDEAAFLATHNSMSTTARRFIGPLQDPDIVSQLDQGARGPLIDTHT